MFFCFVISVVEGGVFFVFCFGFFFYLFALGWSFSKVHKEVNRVLGEGSGILRYFRSKVQI